MRIISKYKDYYDGVQRTDTDGYPVYKRDIVHDVNGRIQTYTQIPQRPPYGKQRYTGLSQFIIGFCGKVYQGFKVHSSCDAIKPDLFFYDIDELIDFLKPLGYFDKTKGRFGYQYYSEKKIRKNYENFNYSYYEKIFLEYRVPIFAFNGEGFFLNFPLDDVKFGKVKDPYTAYQEIDMFLGNQLAESNDPDMPVGGDKIIAESKGYNKQSFRMESPGKKRKKRK
jgi:hypothetical protein